MSSESPRIDLVISLTALFAALAFVLIASG